MPVCNMILMSYLLRRIILEVQTYEKREGERRNCKLSYNSPSGFKFVSGPDLLPNMKKNTQKGKRIPTWEKVLSTACYCSFQWVV